MERFDVVTVPAFVAEFESVRAFYMREHIAPVIVMLNKIALGKADAVSLSAVSVDSVYRDRRYCIVLGPAAEHRAQSQ